jgi:hypothetical protein
LEIGTESGQPDAAFIYGGQIVVVYHQRGRLDELRALIEDMAGSNPNLAGVLSGALTAASPISHYLGGLSIVLGDGDRATRYFAQAASMSRTAGARFSLAQTELLWGRLLVRQGAAHHERARELLENATATSASAGYAGVHRRAAAALDALADRTAAGTTITS